MTATFKLSRLHLSERCHLAWWDATRCFGLVIAVILVALVAYLLLHDVRTSWQGSDLPLVAFARTALTEATV